MLVLAVLQVLEVLLELLTWQSSTVTPNIIGWNSRGAAVGFLCSPSLEGIFNLLYESHFSSVHFVFLAVDAFLLPKSPRPSLQRFSSKLFLFLQFLTTHLFIL